MDKKIGTETLWRDSPSQLLNFWVFLFVGLTAWPPLLVILGFIVMPLAEYEEIDPGFGFVSFFFLLLVFQIALLAFKIVEVHTTKYELNEDLFVYTHGVFNVRVEQMELLRIRDQLIHKPFFLRIFGLGNLTLLSTDESTPSMTIKAVHRVINVAEAFKNARETHKEVTKTKRIELT